VRKGSRERSAELITALEKANEDLKTAQAELQRRWQYLAEAQRLSHSGTFGWKVCSGELVWSDETYRILVFRRETKPTLDLAFDRIHPEDRERLQEIRDRASQSGMDFGDLLAPAARRSAASTFHQTFAVGLVFPPVFFLRHHVARTQVERAFLLTNSPERAEGQQSDFVALARRAGVKHIVKLSQWAASPDSQNRP